MDEMPTLVKTFALDHTQQSFKAGIARFTNAWDARIDVTDSLVDYAQSLSILAAAPSKARRSSEALANSFLSLTSTFGTCLVLSAGLSLKISVALSYSKY